MSLCPDEEDEVVSETDVFLSKMLANSLHLLRYPSKNNYTEKIEEESECISVKIKPQQQKIEMEYAVNIHSNSYDKARGEQIAFNVDGKANANDGFFKSTYMDKHIICGSKSLMSPENFGLGVLKNGEMHIIPFHSILELHPQIVHMDKIDSQAKKANPEEEEEEEEEAVAVTVRFEGANADKNKEMREKSFQFHQQKSASEAWINLNYHGVSSNRAKLECQKITCSQMHKDVSSDHMNPKGYLKTVVPDNTCLLGHQGSNDKEDDMSEKPLSDQMKHSLVNAHIATFTMLVKKLRAIIDEAAVERILHQIAVLVRGCWAVKSELLYPDDTVSSYTGLSSKVLVNARDYILWLFTKSSFITRKEVLSVIHVPNEDFLNMITPLALETDRGWKFKFPVDKDFIESYPEIHERQNMKWDLRYKKLVKDLNIGMQEFEGLSKVPYTAPSRPRQKRCSRSSQSEGDESGTDSTYGNKELKKSKKTVAASSSKSGAKVKACHFASLDISPTFLESSPPADVINELTEYLGDIMRTHYCLTLSEIKELVSQSHFSGIVNRSDFEKILADALQSSGCRKLKNKWPQNTTPETLYAYAIFGNKLDRYRNILLDLFCTTARARINLFVKKVEEELREIVSDYDCRIIFEEYCVHKSGFYYLKGTIALDS